MWSADQPGATCSAPKAISSLGRLSCSPVATLLRGDSTPCLLFYSAVGTKSSCQPSYRVLKALCCGFQDGLVSCNVFYAWCPRSHPTHCSSTSGLRGSLLVCVGRRAECAVPVTSPFRLFCLHSPNLQKGHGPEFSTSVYCPNLQEMGESEPWPPQQRAVTVLRQSQAYRLHPCYYNTHWRSCRHEEVQGTGVGGVGGHGGGSSSYCSSAAAWLKCASIHRGGGRHQG